MCVYVRNNVRTAACIKENSSIFEFLCICDFIEKLWLLFAIEKDVRTFIIIKNMGNTETGASRRPTTAQRRAHTKVILANKLLIILKNNFQSKSHIAEFKTDSCVFPSPYLN